MALLLAALLAGATQAAPTPPTMRVVRAKGLPCKPPDFACITTATAPTPKPRAGQVLVKLIASSVNPSDVDLEESLGRLEGTMGADFIGVVQACPPSGCKRLKVGDRVWGDTKGAFAEYILASEATTGLAPAAGPRQPDVPLGTLPEVASTSLECLQRTQPWKRNATVVVTSGSGGTGFVALQMAKRAFHVRHTPLPPLAASPRRACCCGA